MECRLPEHFVKPGKVNIVQNNSHGFDYYKAMKPVYSEAHKAQEELQKVQDRNIEMRRQIKDLKQRLDKIQMNAQGEDGGAEGHHAAGAGKDTEDRNQAAFEKLYQNDKVIISIEKLHAQKLKEKANNEVENQKIAKEFQNLEQTVLRYKQEIDALDKKITELKATNPSNKPLPTEVDGDNVNLEELQAKRKKEAKEIEKSIKNQNATRSAKNNEFNKVSQQFEQMKDKRNKMADAVEQAQENISIFEEVVRERKRFLISSYLMRGQDDLEKLLQTLNDHFGLIKLTSFEHLARHNLENKSANELFAESNEELKNLNKTLELLQLDEEDVRYSVFEKIYSMLFDNIALRLKQNKLSQRLLAQSQLNILKITQAYNDAVKVEAAAASKRPAEGRDAAASDTSRSYFERMSKLR